MEKHEVKEMIGMVDEVKGVSFASVLYTNQHGETANYVINLGIPHHNVLKKDLVRLANLRTDHVFKAELATRFDEKTIEKAFSEMTASIQSSLDGTNDRAQAQIDAYVKINNGVKYGIDTQKLYLYGYLINKTVLERGEYKPVKSRALTLCKNDIRKLLKGPKYRTFIFDQTDVFATGGDRMVIGKASLIDRAKTWVIDKTKAAWKWLIN